MRESCSYATGANIIAPVLSDCICPNPAVRSLNTPRTILRRSFPLSRSDTVESALTLMTKNNVLSVPVFDTAKRVFVAVLHIMDM